MAVTPGFSKGARCTESGLSAGFTLFFFSDGATPFLHRAPLESGFAVAQQASGET
jgi:hypothetical protein